MTIREGLLVLADGSVFEGELIGAARAGRGRHRRGRVQHRPVRLPGDHHRSQLRRADHHVHVPAHRQLRRHRRRQRVAAAPSAAAWSCATSLAATATSAPRIISAPLLATHCDPRHRRHRHPPPDAPDPRRRRHARRVRRREPRRAGGGRRDRARHRRRRPRRPGHDRRAVHRRRRSAADRRLRLRDQDARSCASSSRLGRVEVVPATTSAADVLARRPDGVFLSNGPGDPGDGAVRRPTRSPS